MIRTGRRVATPSLEPGRSASREEVLEDLSSLTQEQVKMRCKQPLGQRSGLENVAPEVSSPAKLPSPGKLNLSSPNKENEEALNFFQETSQNTFAKRQLMEKEVTEEQMLVEALRTATGQPFAALCGLRKALARPRPPIQGVLRCGGAELLVATLRSTSLSSAGKAEAAWCLVQLASGNSAQTKQLVQAGACTAALEVLQLNSAESSELCDFLLQLLANVGGDVDCGFRDGLLDSDIVNILGHLFAKMPDFTWTSLERCEVLRSFTWLMATLCRGTTAPKLEKVDCAFDFFAQVLQGTADAEMLSSAIWGLCYLLEGAKEDTDRCLRAARMLSAGFDELSEAPEPHPLLQQVVHCLRSPGDWRCPLPSAALRLAGILVELPEPSFTDALLAAGLLGALHADLVDAYAPLQVRRDAAWVLANVAAGNLSQAQRLAEQPGLAEALCDQQTKEVAQECSWAILNLLKHGPDMFTRLGIHRVLGVLLNALHSEAEASLQQAAMEQLELLMQQLTPEASGLVAKLQVLSRSPDNAVLSKAQFLLQNFFPHGSANTKEGSSLGCSK